MRYLRLDGTEFDGPVFHPQMEQVELEDGRVYQTVFRDGKATHRVELAVDSEGMILAKDKGRG